MPCMIPFVTHPSTPYRSLTCRGVQATCQISGEMILISWSVCAHATAHSRFGRGALVFVGHEAFCIGALNRATPPKKEPTMGIWDFVKSELIDVIEWLDDSTDILVWRF